jgi:hypothetical protein
MMRTLFKLVPLAALAAIVATTGLAGAQTAIDVQGTVGVSSRQLFVEDLLGNDLTELDFGTGGALPVQVRVEDDAYESSGFTVDATMTNLYVDSGAALDFDKVIPSANVSLSTLSSPVSVLDDLIDVQATIKPVFDSVTTINNALLCAVLLMANPCQIVANGIEGLEQTVTFAASDLSDLTKLPLVPQEPETGAFTDPDFEGDPGDPEDTAADPAAIGADPATSLQLLGGTVIDDGEMDVVEDLLVTQLGVLDDLDATARNLVIPVGAYQIALQDAVTALIGHGLSAGDLTTALAGTVDLTLEALGADQLVSQTGAYRSFPILQLDIPPSSAAGSYRGTLVVTDIQP